jgi:hypothetical protein
MTIGGTRMTGPKLATQCVLGLTLILALAGLSSTKAELLVSNVIAVRDITPGTRLPDDYVFKLSRRSEIRLIKLPDNIQFVLRGPYEGTLEKFVSDCRGLFGAWTNYCQENPSGEIVGAGGTRSLRPGQ